MHKPGADFRACASARAQDSVPVARHPCLLVTALAAGCAANPATNDATDLNYRAVSSGINYQQRVERYAVTGADRPAIGTSIRAVPPRPDGDRSAGYYQWELAWRFRVKGDGTTCRLSEATVAVNAVVTLPDWKAPAGADPALVEEWQRYLTALTTHEMGHRELVLDGATRIRSALLDLPPKQCGTMQRMAQQAADPLLAQIKLNNKRYDETTRHGATQGAMWSAFNLPWEQPPYRQDKEEVSCSAVELLRLQPW